MRGTKIKRTMVFSAWLMAVTIISVAMLIEIRHSILNSRAANPIVVDDAEAASPMALIANRTTQGDIVSNQSETDLNMQAFEILECDNSSLFDDNEDENRFENFMLAQADRFADEKVTEQGPNYEVMGVLFSTTYDNELRIRELNQLNEKYPNNEFLTKSLLSSCINSPSNPVCDNGIVEKALEVDGGNAFVWSMKAALEINRGEAEQAKASLANAASKEYYRDLIPDFIQYQQLTSDRPSGTELFVQNMGQTLLAVNIMSADGGAGLLSIHNFCTVNSQSDQEAYNSCISFSRLAEEHAGTNMGARLSADIELETKLAVDGVPKYIEAVERDANMRSDYWGDHRNAIDLSSHDERLLDKYTDDLIQFGEHRALQNLVNEARQLSADPNYNPCK